MADLRLERQVPSFTRAPIEAKNLLFKLTCRFLKKDTTVSKGQSTERVLVEIGKISQLNLVHFARSFH